MGLSFFLRGIEGDLKGNNAFAAIFQDSIVWSEISAGSTNEVGNGRAAITQSEVVGNGLVGHETPDPKWHRTKMYDPGARACLHQLIQQPCNRKPTTSHDTSLKRPLTALLWGSQQHSRRIVFLRNHPASQLVIFYFQ